MTMKGNAKFEGNNPTIIVGELFYIDEKIVAQTKNSCPRDQ